MRTRLLQAALLTPPLLVAAGRFLPGPRFWGVNHFAYLPLGVYLAWLACAIAVLAPPVQKRLARLLARDLPAWIYRNRWTGLVLTLACTGVFALFRERSYFMGDGYLIGDDVARKVPFRTFDNMDYLLHLQVYKAQLAAGGHLSSFMIYGLGAVLAGSLGVAMLWSLTRRLPWEGGRRLFVLGLFLLTGPVALFCGYVESYSYLYLFLSAFLVAGVLTCEGKSGLWLPSTLFGAAMFFHLSAAFAAPALLYLAVRAPVRPAARRWFQAAAPALAVFLVSAGYHLALGYNAHWLRWDFLDSKNAQSIWIPLAGHRGLLSVYHWKDLLNLALITSPAAVVVAAGGVRSLPERWADRKVQFLGVQVASIAFFALALDRKLGGARDWDLLAAHAMGVSLLAAVLLESCPHPAGPAGKEGSARGGWPRVAALALTASFLVSSPWIVLLHREPASVARFEDVAGDFPDFARAYAYEGMGKYYRKAADYDRAEEMYRRCAETYPANGRFQFQLASIYMVQQARTADPAQRRRKLELAEQHYREALRSMPDNDVVLSSLGQSLLAEEKFDEALRIFEGLVRVEPKKAAPWSGLGYARMYLGDLEGAVGAFRSALQLDGTEPVHQLLGNCLLGLGRFTEAAPAFEEAARRGDSSPRVLVGLAAARIGEAAAAIQAGEAPSVQGLHQAETSLDALLRRDPENADGRKLRGRLQALKSGRLGS